MKLQKLKAGMAIERVDPALKIPLHPEEQRVPAPGIRINRFTSAKIAPIRVRGAAYFFTLKSR